MVTIVNCVKRTSKEGQDFIALIVQNELEIVTSKHGNVYVAAKRASIPSALDFNTAKMLIGKELPGTIEKVNCQSYDHVTNDGELVSLNYRYQYIPEENRTEVQELQQVEELEEEPVEEFEGV